MFSLSLLKTVSWNKIGHTGSVVAILLLITYNHYLRVRAKEVQYVYSNPKVVEKIVVKRVEGPVRIVTIIKEKPTGEKETTIKEEHESVVETVGEEKNSEPVSTEKMIGDVRRSRLLVGVGLLDLSDERRPMALGGVSVWNRVDLLYGANSEHGKIRHSAFFVARF